MPAGEIPPIQLRARFSARVDNQASAETLGTRAAEALMGAGAATYLAAP